MTSYSGWAGHSLTVVVPVQLQRGLSHTPLPFHSISFFPQNSTSFYLNILLHSFPLNPFSPSFLFPFNHVPFHSFPSLLSPPSPAQGDDCHNEDPTLWCYHHTTRKSAMLYISMKHHKIYEMVSLPFDTTDSQQLCLQRFMPSWHGVWYQQDVLKEAHSSISSLKNCANVQMTEI